MLKGFFDELPGVLLAILLQRYLVRGLSLGAVKG
jgi:ABC-type glycerol-3-phosphate transport system permease component